MKKTEKVDKAWRNFEKSGKIADYLDYSSLKRDIMGESDIKD